VRAARLVEERHTMWERERTERGQNMEYPASRADLGSQVDKRVGRSSGNNCGS